MEYLSVTPTPSHIPHSDKITINDIGTIFAVTIGIGSCCLSAFLMKSKSQAQELDRTALEQTSNQIKKTEENLEKMLARMASTMEKLSDLTSDLTRKIAVLETRQDAFSTSQTQMENIRTKQELLERRITLIEESIRFKS